MLLKIQRRSRERADQRLDGLDRKVINVLGTGTGECRFKPPSPVISHMTSGHVFTFELRLPFATVPCKDVQYMKIWAALCCHGDVV